VQGHVVVFLVKPLVCFGEVVGPEVPAHFLGVIQRVDVPRLVGDYLSFFVAAGYHRAPLPATARFCRPSDHRASEFLMRGHLSVKTMTQSGVTYPTAWKRPWRSWAVLSIAVCRMRVTGAGREAKNRVSGGAGEKTGKDDPHSLMLGADDNCGHGAQCSGGPVIMRGVHNNCAHMPSLSCESDGGTMCGGRSSVQPKAGHATAFTICMRAQQNPALQNRAL
jgi:hypothetical protein